MNFRSYFRFTWLFIILTGLINFKFCDVIWANIDNSEPTAQSAVPGVSPGRGLLVPHGYLHPGKSKHSEVQSSSIIAGAWLWFMGGPPH